MTTAELFDTGDAQAVRLPDGFRFPGDAVSIRRHGAAVILEPLEERGWPEGFFEAIHIDDPAFVRPDQGSLPSAPVLESDP